MFRAFREDLAAVLHNDPAARGPLEAALFHTPLHAIALHRVAHWLQERLRAPLLPRALAMLARFWTGVEIHPAARIGRGFFIDHGTGVVIGETSEIGDHCVLFHNVTLGGTGQHRGKRHPTLGDRVYVGTGSILLGPIHVGEDARVGANTFVRMHDVPAGCTVVGSPGHIVKRDGRRVNEELPPTVLTERSRPVRIA